MPPTAADSSAGDAKLLMRLRKYMNSPELQKQHDPNQYLQTWFHATSLASASLDGKLTWRFPVQKEYLNYKRMFAGGAQAALHDVCTAWTLLTVARPDYWAALGASRTLNISYLTAAREGEELVLETEIVHIGSRMALIKAVIKREKDGSLVSTSEHHLRNDDAANAKL